MAKKLPHVTARNGSISRGCPRRNSRFHDLGANLEFRGMNDKRQVVFRRIWTRALADFFKDNDKHQPTQKTPLVPRSAFCVGCMRLLGRFID